MPNGSFLGYAFKCPRCGRKCKLNKKMAKLRATKDLDKIFYWECDGLSPQAPHPPTSYWHEPLSILFDRNGAKVSQVDRIQELWLEDSEVYTLTDNWKSFMREQRYKRLPEKEDNQEIAS